MKTRSALVGLLAAVALIAGACGGDDDTLSRDELQEELVTNGLTEEQADCLADELGEVTREEVEDGTLVERSAEAGQKCAEELTGVTIPPDASIPDVSIPDVSIPDVSIPE